MTHRPRSKFGLLLAVVGLLALSSPAASTALAQVVPATPTDAASPVDIVPPVIAQPLPVEAAAVDAFGARVSYPVPGALDERDGPLPVACAPTSGALFPLGQTVVACAAADAAGNRVSVSFSVTVTDQTSPVIAQPDSVAVEAVDASGVTVFYPVPPAKDNVDAPILVDCTPLPGVLFPVGPTKVSCSARDVAGNAAEAVTFTVTVNPPPAPTATAPTTTEGTSTPTEGPTATGSTTGAVAETTTAAAADAPTTSAAAPATDPSPSAVPSTAPSAAPTPIPSQHPDVVGAASGATRVADGVPASAEVAASPRPALQLPWPPPSAFVLVTDGGPLDGLAAIWRYEEFPVTQEFGHTLFSILHHAWYAYGAAYGLDGYEHPGLDIGMPAGTWLYSPVSGTVKIAGGVPYFTFYGNGRPGVGQLMIETDDGDQVILGHMGLIAVEAGQRVEVGQFVGLSGGENGDHLHLEARELQLGGGYRAVDPRQSFLIAVLKAASERAAAEMTVDEGDGMR